MGYAKSNYSPQGKEITWKVPTKKVTSRKKTPNYAEIEIRVSDDDTRQYLLEETKRAIRRWNRSHDNKLSYAITTSSNCNC